MTVRPKDLRKLYKALLRHSARLSDYHVRENIKQRTQEAFREHRHEADPKVVNKLYYDGLNNLAVLKRQVAISRIITTDPALH